MCSKGEELKNMCPGYRGTFQPKRESKKREGSPGDGAANIKLLILPEFTSHQTDEPTLEPQYPGRERKKETTKQKRRLKPANLWMGTF